MTERDPGTGQWNGIPARRRAFRRFAAAYDLAAHVVLTYEDDLVSWRVRLDRMSTFIDTIEKTVNKPVPWLRAMHRGNERNRIHEHFMLPRGIRARVIDEAWPWGRVKVIRLTDVTSIRHVARYIVKPYPGMPGGRKPFQTTRRFPKPVARTSTFPDRHRAREAALGGLQDPEVEEGWHRCGGLTAYFDPDLLEGPLRDHAEDPHRPG